MVSSHYCHGWCSVVCSCRSWRPSKGPWIVKVLAPTNSNSKRNCSEALYQRLQESLYRVPVGFLLGPPPPSTSISSSGSAFTVSFE
ncbi:hypothetical protein FOYG_03193 [Fusarium oxysporum NRRL 32931]|uniref:Uncharacterized protein n=1 Tax=Fusarium oxysporum NRRL 32931 TaxID=660029 RepID=W9IVF2_FUSOX|nr:hypothetical protein FOYG_03193 [Fusarium oxysporum NRRL 32931]